MIGEAEKDEVRLLSSCFMHPAKSSRTWLSESCLSCCMGEAPPMELRPLLDMTIRGLKAWRGCLCVGGDI